MRLLNPAGLRDRGRVPLPEPPVLLPPPLPPPRRSSCVPDPSSSVSICMLDASRARLLPVSVGAGRLASPRRRPRPPRRVGRACPGSGRTTQNFVLAPPCGAPLSPTAVDVPAPSEPPSSCVVVPGNTHSRMAVGVAVAAAVAEASCGATAAVMDGMASRTDPVALTSRSMSALALPAPNSLELPSIRQQTRSRGGECSGRTLHSQHQ